MRAWLSITSSLARGHRSSRALHRPVRLASRIAARLGATNTIFQANQTPRRADSTCRSGLTSLSVQLASSSSLLSLLVRALVCATSTWKLIHAAVILIVRLRKKSDKSSRYIQMGACAILLLANLFLSSNTYRRCSHGRASVPRRLVSQSRLSALVIFPIQEYSSSIPRSYTASIFQILSLSILH